jgi:hypothetical protein
MRDKNEANAMMDAMLKANAEKMKKQSGKLPDLPGGFRYDDNGKVISPKDIGLYNDPTRR